MVSVWVAALVLLYLYSKAVRFVRLIRASKRLQKERSFLMSPILVSLIPYLIGVIGGVMLGFGLGLEGRQKSSKVASPEGYNMLTLVDVKCDNPTLVRHIFSKALETASREAIAAEGTDGDQLVKGRFKVVMSMDMTPLTDDPKGS